jgi:hypothetical protein
MRYILILLVLSIANIGCSQKMIISTPSCIEKKIAEIKKEPRWNPPAEINEYEYLGKKVFLISANCCDQYITLVDENCNYLCAPAGGFTGKGDGKCKDFNEKAKLVKLVWQDDR